MDVTSRSNSVDYSQPREKDVKDSRGREVSFSLKPFGPSAELINSSIVSYLLAQTRFITIPARRPRYPLWLWTVRIRQWTAL